MDSFEQEIRRLSEAARGMGAAAPVAYAMLGMSTWSCIERQKTRALMRFIACREMVGDDDMAVKQELIQELFSGLDAACKAQLAAARFMQTGRWEEEYEAAAAAAAVLEQQQQQAEAEKEKGSAAKVAAEIAAEAAAAEAKATADAEWRPTPGEGVVVGRKRRRVEEEEGEEGCCTQLF